MRLLEDGSISIVARLRSAAIRYTMAVQPSAHSLPYTNPGALPINYVLSDDKDC
jgi:hypothetical protein